MNPRVTWLPPQQQTRSAPRFDRTQFDSQSRSLKGRGVDYADLQHLSVLRVADLRNGRRLEAPAWAMRDELLRGVVVRCLENRFMLRNRQGTLRERLDRCRAAAKRHAAAKRKHLDAHVQQLRALSHQQLASLSKRNYEQLFLETLRTGNGAAARLNALENHIRNADGDLFVTERAPELLAAIFYNYYRLGHNSPTVAEQLSLTPCQVRQILFRANRIARKEESTTPRKRARLNRSKAEEIRRLAASGTPWEEIAAKFSIARETVRRIVQGKTWRAS